MIRVAAMPVLDTPTRTAPAAPMIWKEPTVIGTRNNVWVSAASVRFAVITTGTVAPPPLDPGMKRVGIRSRTRRRMTPFP